MKKKRHYHDHHHDLDSYSDSERDEVHGYRSMSTTHHSKHRDRRTSNVSQHYNGHDWYLQEKVKDMESYSRWSHYSHSPQPKREKPKGNDHHHQYSNRTSESDLDTTSHNDGEWYQSQHQHHRSHHDHYYSDSDTDIQPSSHRSCHLDRDRYYENDCENNKRNITNGCTSRQKHKRDYSSGNESNSNDIPPHGSIRKRQKYTDDQSYDKSNAYQGNKYFDQKSSEKHYSPKHSNERFPGLHPSDHQSYEKSNAYKVNKKFTNQKSSEKSYTPKCGDKLPAIHPVNEKSPAHHQVNEKSCRSSQYSV